MTSRFKSKKLGNSISYAVVLAGALALSGCIGEQKEQIAQCEQGAQSVAAVQDAGQTPVPGKVSRGAELNYITQCMKVAGYKYAPEMGIDDCHGGSTNEKNPYCYLPENQIKKVIFWALYM